MVVRSALASPHTHALEAFLSSRYVRGVAAMTFVRFQLVVIILYLVTIVSPCHAQAPPEVGPPQNNSAAANSTNPNNANPPKPTLRTVITVTGQPVAVSLAPASVSVVDDEQLKDARALTSSDIMRTVPFVSLEQNGSAGSLSTLTIRGGKPNLVLMLIDGIPVNDLSNLLGGSFDFSNLSTHDVERVEVVRGPLSSGYGSEAMSGVINVITKPEHYESDVTASVETGSFGTAGVDLGTEGSEGQFGYKLSGSFLRVGDQVESDSFSTSTFSAGSDYTRSPDSTVSWTARWIQFDGSSFPENGGGPDLSILRIPKTSNSGNFLAGFLFQHQFSKIWSAGVNVDVFTRGEHSYTPPILDNTNPSPNSQPSLLTGTRFTLVPYRGGAPALQDIVAGNVDIMCDLAANSLAQVKAGNIKAYAVASKKRWFAAPDVPTVGEAGAPGVEVTNWLGAYAPKDTPKDIVAKLNAAFNGAMADPSVRQRIADQGLEIPPIEQQTPEAFAAYLKAEMDKWGAIIRESGIKVQ